GGAGLARTGAAPVTLSRADFESARGGGAGARTQAGRAPRPGEGAAPAASMTRETSRREGLSERRLRGLGSEPWLEWPAGGGVVENREGGGKIPPRRAGWVRPFGALSRRRSMNLRLRQPIAILRP